MELTFSDEEDSSRRDSDFVQDPNLPIGFQAAPEGRKRLSAALSGALDKVKEKCTKYLINLLLKSEFCKKLMKEHFASNNPLVEAKLELVNAKANFSIFGNTTIDAIIKHTSTTGHDTLVKIQGVTKTELILNLKDNFAFRDAAIQEINQSIINNLSIELMGQSAHRISMFVGILGARAGIKFLMAQNPRPNFRFGLGVGAGAVIMGAGMYKPAVSAIKAMTPKLTDRSAEKFCSNIPRSTLFEENLPLMQGDSNPSKLIGARLTPLAKRINLDYIVENPH